MYNGILIQRGPPRPQAVDFKSEQGIDGAFLLAENAFGEQLDGLGPGALRDTYCQNRVVEIDDIAALYGAGTQVLQFPPGTLQRHLLQCADLTFDTYGHAYASPRIL